MTVGQSFVTVDDLMCQIRARRVVGSGAIWSGAIWRRRPLVRVVDGVSFAIPRGRTLGLVGESGSGKTTIARAMLGLIATASGRVSIDGERVTAGRDAAWRRHRRRMQMVYQDAAGALDRRMTVAAQLCEPLDIHGISNPSDRPDVVRLRLAEVGLGADLGGRYPHELSGGQRQRVVLARALMVDPDLLVCDEPVSALDVSVQAQVLGLLEDLTVARGLTMLFISHDLRVVRQIADRIAVLYLGRIVEEGPAEAVLPGRWWRQRPAGGKKGAPSSGGRRRTPRRALRAAVSIRAAQTCRRSAGRRIPGRSSWRMAAGSLVICGRGRVWRDSLSHRPPDPRLAHPAADRDLCLRGAARLRRSGACNPVGRCTGRGD
jgi:ABC-type oligopeptide transport system ATPase subunit